MAERDSYPADCGVCPQNFHGVLEAWTLSVIISARLLCAQRESLGAVAGTPALGESQALGLGFCASYGPGHGPLQPPEHCLALF